MTTAGLIGVIAIVITAIGASGAGSGAIRMTDGGTTVAIIIGVMAA